MNQPAKVAIIVRGGVVQEVRTDHAKLEVQVFDFDNEPELELPKQTLYPHEVDIS